MTLDYMDRATLAFSPPLTGRAWREPGRPLTGAERTAIYRLRRAGLVPPADRLAAELEANAIRTPYGCLEWTRARNASGYGHLKRGGRMVYAHRLSLEAKLGRPITPGMVACHSCDNPPCIEPAHLSEGTPADNTNEWYARGRFR